MLEESLGGFFVDIKAKIDGSFDKSKKEIKALGDSIKSLVGTVSTTSAALVGLATVAGNVETKNLKMAQSIGISATELDKWKIAAGIAGTNADALVGSMDSIEQKMRGLKTGQVDMNLAKNLGFMGIGYSDFADMDADERMKQIFNKASGMQDQEKASKLVSDILGEAGKDYYSYLKLSGKSIDEQLAKAKRLNFTDERSKREAMAFNQEIKGLFETTKSLGTFIASKIGVQLTPIIRKITDLLAKNKELIKSGITGFVNSVGSAFNSVVNIFERVAPIVSRLIDNFGGLDKVIMKVGIGFATLKFAKIAGGVMQVVKSVGLLKGALMGLGIGALILLIDDLMSFLTKDGRKSMFGWLFEHLDEIKDKFSNLLPNLNTDSFAEAIKNIKKTLEDLKKWIKAVSDVSEPLKKIWSDLGGVWKETLGNVLTNTLNFAGNSLAKFVDMFNWLCEAISEFEKGGIEGGLKFVGKSIKEKIESIGEAGATAYQEARKQGKGIFEAAFLGYDATIRETPLGTLADATETVLNNAYELGTALKETVKATGKSVSIVNDQKKINDFDEKAYKEMVKKLGNFRSSNRGILPAFKDLSEEDKKYLRSLDEEHKANIEKYSISGKIEDGIISPSGRVTQVSPQDWVIAAKDLGNVASAFLPRGLTNISSSMNAPTVINQNFTITASNRELVPAIKQQAYKGANDALLQNMRKSSNILQQMNGTR